MLIWAVPWRPGAMDELHELPLTIRDCLRQAVARNADGEALVTRSARLSWRQLDDLADRARDALWSLGLRPGDRVAACLPNDLDVVLSFHGAMRLGAVWLGVNRKLAPPEKEYLLEDAGAALLLCEAETDEQLVGRRPATRRVAVGATGEWAAALGEAPAVQPPPVDPFAPAALAYTSGTTGHPKGAVQSQHNLLLPACALVASRGYGPELRKGDCFPLTVLNMHVLSTLLVARAGGCSVIMDRIDAEGVADWIRREGVTLWNGPPALLHSMVTSEVEPEALASLDEIWSGGGDFPEQLRERFAARFGVSVLVSYGLSEAPSVVTLDPQDGEHRPGASGRPSPQLRVELRDEEGRVLATGERGEICVGPVTEGPWAGRYRPMLGYLGREEATAEALAGGVLHTGDIGYLDEDGFLHVVDRKSLMIIRGGANVYPAEVERVLLEAPGVVDCAVFGIPDERLGERVMAAVVLEGGIELQAGDLEAHCRGSLARYKVPERFVAVEVLARNEMGKVERAGLAQLLG